MGRVRIDGAKWRRVVLLCLTLFVADVARLAVFEPRVPQHTRVRGGASIGALSRSAVLFRRGIAFAQPPNDCGTEIIPDASCITNGSTSVGGTGEAGDLGDPTASTSTADWPSIWPSRVEVWGSWNGVIYYGVATRNAGSNTYTFDMTGQDGSEIQGVINMTYWEAMTIDLFPGADESFSNWSVEYYTPGW